MKPFKGKIEDVSNYGISNSGVDSQDEVDNNGD